MERAAHARARADILLLSSMLHAAARSRSSHIGAFSRAPEANLRTHRWGPAARRRARRAAGAARGAPPPARGRGRRGAARARRGPLARRGSRPPPPGRDRRGEGAPLLRLCDMAILFYKAYTQFMNSHHPKCTLTLWSTDREIRHGTIQQPCPFAVGDGVAPRGPPRARPAPHHVPQTARTPRRARRTSHVVFPAAGGGTDGLQQAPHVPERAAALRRRPQK